MLSYAAFEGNLQQTLSLDGKFHWQLVHHLFGVAVNYKTDSVFGGNSALVAVEYLVLVDFRSCGFVLHDSGVVLHIDLWESVGTACRAKQQAVALGVVSHARSSWHHFHQSAVAVLAMAGRDAFRNDS